MVVSSVRSRRKYPFAGSVPLNVTVTLALIKSDQPFKLIGEEVVLKSSIHSSFALAAVPPHAISLMTTARTVTAVGVGVNVFVCVGVLVLVAVGVLVDVAVFVKVGVGVGVLVADEHGASVVAVLRGFAVNRVKSVELLSVSVQPFAARTTALTLSDGPVAGAVSEQFVLES